MNPKPTTVLLLIVLVVSAGCGDANFAEDQAATAPSDTAPAVQSTPDEQVAELERMCAGALASIEARQAEKTLYDRVGGRDGLQAVVVDTVRRHHANDQIKHLLDGVDIDRLVMQVTDFLVVGTGGEGEYKGRDMRMAHAHLNLTNADFLAAGGDLGAAMESAGWGEDERQELLCAFVGLRGEVVTPETKDTSKARF